MEGGSCILYRREGSATSPRKRNAKRKMVVRESFPRQVDKKSRGPQGERGLEFSRRKKGQTFFFSTFLRII